MYQRSKQAVRPVCLGQAQAVIFKPGAGQASSLKYTGRLAIMFLLIFNKNFIFVQKNVVTDKYI